MPNSAHFHTLRKRLSALRKRFLPKNFSATGVYTSAQLDGARAYRLLSHAEIEHFLETRTLEIADAAFKVWSSKRKASRPLVHLFASHQGDLGGIFAAKFTVDYNAGRCLGQYRRNVQQNHGVKRDNILQLVTPVGLEEGNVDPVLIATLEAFGKERGKAAHASSVTYTIDPKSEFDTIVAILTGIKDLDNELSSLLSMCA